MIWTKKDSYDVSIPISLFWKSEDTDELPRRKKCILSVYAVSYTHLRAHETVLDLVCRLLLEKKKKNTIMTRHVHTINKASSSSDDHCVYLYVQ
ncbi:hypothetical protein PVA38_11310 [Streptococcus pneumoniae D39]|nr:hypothetical protein PVA38_11310 [Streptococcus pneumoniae D39]